MRRLKVIGDSDYGKWRDRLKLRTTARQDKFCLMMERWGQRFLVDFGYENAEEKFNALLEKRLEQVSEIM